MDEAVCGARLSAQRRALLVSAAIAGLVLAGLLQLAPSASARATAVIEVTILKNAHGRTIAQPEELNAADGDTLRFCNTTNVIASLFSGAKYNEFGGGLGGRPGSGFKVLKGACGKVTLHNPTDKRLRVYIGSEIQGNIKVIVWVAPCGAPRSTQSAGALCKKKAATPAGTFVLAGNKVTNASPKELKINAAAGTATWDHCCDGGGWKVEYAWKVPGTLTAGRSSEISMTLKATDVKPEQPLALQMSALHPDFRQDLPINYPNPASASKTYKVPLSAGYAGFKEVVVYIGFEYGQIAYTYRRTGA